MSYSIFLLKIGLTVFLYGVDSESSDPKLLVLSLSAQNFQSVIAKNDFVLVNFYAPGCGACKGLAPEYEKAAALMSERNNNIKIAKIDAIEETEIAKKYDIEGYPTVKFFRKGLRTLDYTGMRRGESIVSWLLKRTAPPATLLRTVKEAKDLIKSNDVVTIGFFQSKSDKEAKTYLDAAELSDDSVFAITYEKKILKNFNTKTGSIIVFNKEYEKEAVFDKEFTEYDILKFVEIRSLPLIMEYEEDKSVHIFTGYIKLHLLLFLPKSDPTTEQHLREIQNVARDFKNEMLFTFMDADTSIKYKELFDYLGVTTRDKFPTVRIIHFKKGLKRYKPANPEISADNLRNFVKDFFDGKLKRSLKSDELLEDWNKEPVHVLVGDNFESVVMDPTKDVLVEFYAPWCSRCKDFAPIYDQIGKHYEAREDLIIANVDATTNEFENKAISGVPTITLYTKTNNIIDFNGKPTFEALIKFIESGGVNPDKAETISEDEETDEDGEDENEVNLDKDEL